MNELLNIKDMLSKDLISYHEAFELIKKLPKAWGTKEWKDLRARHLKDSCENCGSCEKPLVIQHKKQPISFKVFYDEIMSKHIDYHKIRQDVVTNKITRTLFIDFLNKNSELRSACPECNNISVREKKTIGKFICANKHIFETPKKIMYCKPARTSNKDKAIDWAINRLVSDLIYEEVKIIRNQNDNIVGKEALLKSIQESIEYREFKYVKTCCKRCAFIEDKKRGYVKIKC